MEMVGLIWQLLTLFTTFFIWWAAMTFLSVLAMLLHLELQPLVATIPMPFHKVVVDFLIRIHCMDWIDHCQEVLEGNHSYSLFKWMLLLKSAWIFPFISVCSMIRYTAASSDHPERRQPLAFEVWQSVTKQLGAGEKITVLTNGPLTNLANISLSDRKASTVIEVRFCRSNNMKLNEVMIFD